ncbi:unnamed protein product [Lampetra planeri]
MDMARQHHGARTRSVKQLPDATGPRAAAAAAPPQPPPPPFSPPSFTIKALTSSHSLAGESLTAGVGPARAVHCAHLRLS